jgi:heme-degrading monooxygenase HmoA
VHWARFSAITRPEQLSLTAIPERCLSWKFGPDGPVGPNGYRLPSDVWCGVALFADEAAAEAAFERPDRHVPSLSNTLENWHALLRPIAHRGECNHLSREQPGLIFDVDGEDTGGPLFVMTTAGFNIGPDLDFARVVDFRVNVDKVHDSLQSVAGRIASQVFTPHTVGDDGVTMTFWRSDEDMIATMYRPGAHRTQMERYKQSKTADRTSFTRFRVLRTAGTWGGEDPMQRAREGYG